MKIKYPSTLNEPIQFFRWFLNFDVLESYQDWFYDDKGNFGKEPRINPSQKANREHCLIEYKCPNSNFETVQLKFDDALEKFVNIQASQSISLIKENVNAIIKDSKQYENQLKFYVKELNDLEYSSVKILEEYPLLLKPLIDIQNYINIRYLKGAIREYINSKDENEKLIYDVFSYLSGKNEQNSNILDRNEYDRLIEYLKEFIDTKEVPVIKKKISKLNGVDKLTLRRTFYKFWKILSDKEISRNKIVKFLKHGFKDLEETEEKTLYDNLTKKPEYWKDFVPNIVKELL